MDGLSLQVHVVDSSSRSIKKCATKHVMKLLTKESFRNDAKEITYKLKTEESIPS